MRHLLIIIITISLSLVKGFSQKIDIGFESNVGISNCYNTLVETEFKENIGFMFNTGYALKDKFSIIFGVGYDLSGYSYEVIYASIDGYSESNTKISNNYLTIPVKLRFSKLGRNEKLNFRFGLYYSYMISEIQKVNGYSTFTDGRDRIDYDSKENVTNNILNLGRNDLGLDIDFTRTLTSFGDLDFDLGLYSKIGLLPTIKPDLNKNYSIGLKLLLTRDI